MIKFWGAEEDKPNSPYMLSTRSIAAFNASPGNNRVAISGISELELSVTLGRGCIHKISHVDQSGT